MIQMIFTLLLLCATVARGTIVQRPKNLAVSAGGSSYFNCSINDNRNIEWAFSPNGDPGGSTGVFLTDSSCNIVAGFSGNFRTEKPNSTVCNLIVFNANLQLGGYYACISSPATYQGILVVADTDSNITSNATEVVEGCEDDVFFELTVNYSGPLPVAPKPPPPAIALPQLYPSFKWTSKLDPANTIPSSETVTNTTSSSHIIVTATVPSIPSYVCTLYFKPPKGQPTNCDNSTPSFTFDWETQEKNTSSSPPLKCECPPSYPVDDSTDVIILGVFLGLSLLLNFALIVWILLPVMRKKSSPTEASSRPMEYANISPENSKTVNQSPTTGPYEELHRDPKPPTAVVYQGLSKSNA